MWVRVAVLGRVGYGVWGVPYPTLKGQSGM